MVINVAYMIIALNDPSDMKRAGMAAAHRTLPNRIPTDRIAEPYLYYVPTPTPSITPRSAVQYTFGAVSGRVGANPGGGVVILLGNHAAATAYLSLRCVVGLCARQHK